MKTLKYLLAAACAFSLSACEDFLTEDARGDQNLDTYFKTNEEVFNYVMGCYQNLTFNGWWQIQNPWMVMETAGDDLWAGNTSQECSFFNVTEYRPNMAENGELSNFWQYRYKAILNTNVGLERVANAPIDPEAREVYMAELRFLRAYYYFELVRSFGGVPLISSFAMPDQLEGIKRSSKEDVYKFIEDELTDAARHLPERSKSQLGRATRGAALGILAKAQLYQEKWADCAANCKLIIDSHEYELLPSFGDVWSVNTNNSKEGIFEVQHMFDETYTLGSSLPTITGARSSSDPADGWCWFQPTSDLENAFIAAGDTERLRWSIIKSGCTEIAGEDNFQVYLDHNSEIVKTIDAALIKQWADDLGLDFESQFILRPDVHKSGRIIRKFFVPYNDRPSIMNTDRVPLNFRLLRYADVLLMRAEACCEMGGHDSEAREALNLVRQRAKLPDVTASGNQLRQAIRAERRLELCFENNRIYDIRRWKDSNGQPVIASIMGANGSLVQYNKKKLDPFEAYNSIESSDAKGAGFNPATHLVFPIPIYEIQHSNGSIEQNPGY